MWTNKWSRAAVCSFHATIADADMRHVGACDPIDGAIARTAVVIRCR
jgi:hypothetical protein